MSAFLPSGTAQYGHGTFLAVRQVSSSSATHPRRLPLAAPSPIADWAELPPLSDLIEHVQAGHQQFVPDGLLRKSSATDQRVICLFG